MRRLLPFVLLFLSFTVRSQDIHFVQFTETPQLINPGLTGVFDGNARAIVNYRDQWATVDVPYRSFAFNYDHRIMQNKWKKASLGIGVAAYRDDAGDLGLHTTSGILSLASTLRLTRVHSLTAGIQGGIIYRGIDMTNAIWGNQYDGNNYDPTMGSGEVADFAAFIQPDVSLGFAWNMHDDRGFGTLRDFKLRAGSGLFHVNRPRMRFNLSEDDRLHVRWTLHADAEMTLANGRSAILPMFLFQLQGPSTEAVFGALYRFGLRQEARVTGFVKGAALSLGATYRWGDAITPIVAVHFRGFRLGVSYDVNISKLSKATGFQGGLEVSLKFIASEGFYFSGRQSRQ